MSFIRGFGAGRKTPRQFDTIPGMGRVRDSTIYIGFVKDNVDVQRMGRLSVWIPEIGGDPNDEQNWFVVSYASPFAGVTNPKQLVQDSTTEDGSQKSYGMWMVPPDLENQVLVTFVNGDTTRGFWFACIWQQNMNHMVPGLASDVTTEPPNQQTRCGNLPPVVEYNKRSSVNPDNPRRPVFSALTNGLSNQGLFSDTERGVSSTSARREAPSQAFGFLTPRGNTVHVDDNPSNEFIRMRTRSGAQILIHETTGYIYINSKGGNSWVEISDVGVDIYSKGAVSLRSQGTLNIRADGNINFESGGDMNLLANGKLTLQSATSIQSKTNGAIVFESDAGASIKCVGDLLLDAGGNLRLGSGSDLTAASGGNNVRTAAQIFDNSSPSAPSPSAPAAVTPSTQILVDTTGSAPCFAHTSVQTILTRMPTHEPYVGHPNHGVALPENASASDISNATAVQSSGQVLGSGQVQQAPPGVDNSPKQVACSAHISAAVLAAIRNASNKTGIDFGYLMAMAKTESSFNPNAQAGTSSAKGLYQLLDGTWTQLWNKYGAANQVDPSNHFDPTGNALLGAFYAKDNQTGLANAGLTTTPTDLYMAHFLGLGGAKKFLTAMRSDPNQRADTVMGAQVANANQGVFYKNGQALSLQQVYQNFQNKIVPFANCFEKYKTADNPS